MTSPPPEWSGLSVWKFLPNPWPLLLRVGGEGLAEGVGPVAVAPSAPPRPPMLPVGFDGVTDDDVLPRLPTALATEPTALMTELIGPRTAVTTSLMMPNSVVNADPRALR